jgi:hypothetical protein
MVKCASISPLRIARLTERPAIIAIKQWRIVAQSDRPGTAFGLYCFSTPERDAVAIYGSPVAAAFKVALPYPLELLRLWQANSVERPLTEFLGGMLRLLKRIAPQTSLVISCADPAAGHNGTVYRAANFEFVRQSRMTMAHRRRHDLERSASLPHAENEKPSGDLEGPAGPHSDCWRAEVAFRLSDGARSRSHHAARTCPALYGGRRLSQFGLQGKIPGSDVRLLPLHVYRGSIRRQDVLAILSDDAVAAELRLSLSVNGTEGLAMVLPA